MDWSEDMKLKTRIIISFFVIILFPLALTGIALMGFTSYQMRAIEEQYGIDGVTYQSLSNNTLILDRISPERILSKNCRGSLMT